MRYWYRGSLTPLPPPEAAHTKEGYIILSFLNGARKNIDFELTRMIENVKRPKTMDFERTGMIESALKRPIDRFF